MKQSKRVKRVLGRKALGLLMSVVMIVGVTLLPVSGGDQVVQAAQASITSMAYYSPADGPVLTSSGVGSETYGFVMPVFNEGAVKWKDISSDLTVNVKVNGNWVNIDDEASFIYNVNWGHWDDSGFNGYWFTVEETTQIQLVSKANNVTLDYTFVFTNIEEDIITSMAVTQGPELTAPVTGSIGFTYPIFNGDTSIPYDAVAKDLKVYVKNVGSNDWIDIDNNAASGWIYDQNFGQFRDGGGGYWFTIDESINVKLESISSQVSIVYTLNYNTPVRNTNVITANGATSLTADESGAIGIALPNIDGSAAVVSELDNFVYEIKVNNEWVELADYSKSTFSYSGNGYNKLSDKNQWGYWVDYVYGLWFQPIQIDMALRIGYPIDGVKGGSIGDNYVNYNFIGNPDVVRPDVSDLGNIEIGTSNNSAIAGQRLVWSDEFEGNSLDTSKWNYETGYYLNDDPGTWGWGNNELQHYTDSSKNVYVQDGKLNLTAYPERKTFPQDPNRYAEYSSGKVTSKDKYAVKYGRIDFSAKLPTGNGMWPALWLLPNDDTYGTWAASGEIDVMEARGRLPGASSAALHFGGQWPANTYIGSDYAFPSGESIDSDFHVYSIVWEEDNMKWYVDGHCFFKATNEQWYSAADSQNKNAPFDKEFYLIMNLAAGGWFDGGIVPELADFPATMQVDYVRVYKADGDVEPDKVLVTGMVLDQSEVILNSVGQTTMLSKTITPSNASNKNVTWTSSNPQVATVSGGQITAIANGTATITAISQDGGYSSSCTVTVNITDGGQESIIVGDDIRGLVKTGDTVTFYVNEASFADVHYKINDGGQQNVGMASNGSGDYSYVINNLEKLDKIVYSFTYNPGAGALDTETFTYIHGVTQGPPVGEGGNPGDGSDTSQEHINLALGKTVMVSGTEDETVSEKNLTDGNTQTRWSSNFSDDAWFAVDLGDVYSVNHMILNWEGAYGKQYEILISEDGINYTSVTKVINGMGQIETVNLDEVSARYVKFQGIERALPYGYSLYEIEVYGLAK